MSDTYTQLEQLFKAKNWQGCINLIQSPPPCDLTNLDDTQQKNHLWWTGQAYRHLSQYENSKNQFHSLIHKFPDNHLGFEGLINIAQQQKDWKAVIEQSLEFQTKFPSLWHSYWWLGRAYLNTKEYDKAEQWFGLLAQRLPKQHHGIFGLAETAYHAKNWELAIERNLKLQNEFPNLWQGYWWAGYSYKNTKEYEKAEEQFELLSQKFPKQHHGIFGLAEIAYEMTNWELAISRGLELQIKKPDAWQGYWWVGHAYKNLLQYNKAEEQFHLLTQKLPSIHRGMQGLVNIAQHKKDWKATIDIATQFQTKFPELWHSYWWLGQAYKNICEYEKAEEQFLIIQEKFPNSHLGYEGMVNVAQHQQNKPLVIERAMIFQTKFPNLWHGYWWLGQTYKELYQYEKSEEWFQLFQKNLPNDHRGYEGLIFIPQHKQDWQETIKQSLIFQTKFPNMWQGYWWAGQAYKNICEYKKAEEQFLIIQEKFPNDHRGYEGVINIQENKQDWHSVIELAQKFNCKFPNMWHSYWWLGNAYKNLGCYDIAESFFQKIICKFSTHTAGYRGMINIAWDRQDWDKLGVLSEDFIKIFPHETLFYKFKGLSLINLKRFQDAETYILNQIRKFPHNIDLNLTLINVYYPQRKRAKVIDVLTHLHASFPYNRNIVQKLIDAYIANNEPEMAINLLNDYKSYPMTIDEKIALAKIIQIQDGHFQYINELENIYGEYPNDIKVAISLSEHILNHTLESNDNQKRRPSYAIKILEDIYKKYPNNKGVVHKLAFAYIRLGMHENAKYLIKNKLENYEDSYTLKLKSWLAYKNGNFVSLHQYNEQIIKKSFYAELLHKQKGRDLIYRSKQNLPKLTQQDIPMFSVEYNEILRLPYFLEYYRKLGITHFFFVDNNSNDGSFEFLLSQPDCYVFWTDTSYSEAGSGISWVHALIDEYAIEGQWCIHADSDEFLIYPHCETHKLPQIIEYLEIEQSQMMHSFMLDMYPKDLHAQLNAGHSQNIIDISPYFYNDYEHRYQVECPYVHTLGGIFYKFEVAPFAFTKTALFKHSKNFRFLSSTHRTTPAKISSVSSAYLHFKMLGDFQAKAKAESERKEHAGGGVMYRKYAQMYDNFINSDTDLSQLDKSVKYQNSQQLVDLGLIQTSNQWEKFCQSYKGLKDE